MPSIVISGEDVKKLIPKGKQCHPFLMNETFADIYLVTEDGRHRFPAHRTVLSLKSDELMAKFESRPELKEFRIKNCCPEAIECFLHYVYNNDYIWDRRMSTAKDVVKLSNEFRVFGLVVRIIDDVIEAIGSEEDFLNAQTFVDILLFLTTNAIHDSKVNKVLDYGFNNKKTILSSELLRFESKDRLQMAIKALKASPSQIIEALTEEVMTGSGKTAKDFEELIDLNACSLLDVITLIEKNLFKDRDLLAIAKTKAKVFYNI